MSNSLAAAIRSGSATPMNDTATREGQASGRTPKPRRGGPSGRLTVGEHVGQPAGEAAQAVRRAGLRPGLDRSFGCEPELVGQVVAQEPAAGSDLARNGLVTLYVAAPGVAQPDEDAPQTQAAPDPPVPAVPAAAEASEEAAGLYTHTRRSLTEVIAHRLRRAPLTALGGLRSLRLRGRRADLPDDAETVN